MVDGESLSTRRSNEIAYLKPLSQFGFICQVLVHYLRYKKFKLLMNSLCKYESEICC